MSYKLTQHLSAFGEGKMTYTQNNGDPPGGGTTKTEIWSPNVGVGLAYAF